MTGQQALTMACNMLAEANGGSDIPDSFIDRAPYLLAAFCGEARVIDERYREAFSLGDQPAFDRSFIGLSDRLPLCDRLAPTAAIYLAATLLIDEAPALSETFAERCRESLAEAYGEIPATLHSITDVYS